LGIIAMGVGAILFAPAVSAQVTGSSQLREYMRRQNIIMDVIARAREVMPQRRDEPLRDINISDEEVREIQVLVRDVLPRAIVNIGPVVIGCPCEEGRSCSEQVYVQANSAARSMGLLLSRSRHRWSVSEVQKWWLRWNAFEETRDKLDWDERDERAWQLVQDFPVCTPGTPKAENAAVPPPAEPSK
jgi:hypothetical protein